MGLWGMFTLEKILRKYRNMVSLDVYSDIIMPLKFLISYINIVSVEGSSIVLYIECLRTCCIEKIFKKWHNLMSFSVYSEIILS